MQLRLANAVEVSGLGENAIDAGEISFNLSTTTDVDSSAIAVLVGWQRHARQRNQAPQFSALTFSLSPNLTALVRLYGVDEFIASSVEENAVPTPV
jgi:phospholipid transport system transporter-binding protein